ncbi:hypothetical protein DdX_08910 [Ditylenchus destructor]|uniref:Uncharacterized protein n=1 Tax=Ditylenchus destructor TaxID=166010 RepID=A0AAD4R3U5_9BILA|nr:hypothetical protein DdX_08910 [Ditylenchus destructor]
MSLSKKESACDAIQDTNLSSLKETSEIDGSMEIFTPEVCLPKIITRLGPVQVQEVKWQSGKERNHYTYTVLFKPGSSTTLTNRSDSLSYQGDTCSEHASRCYQDDSHSKTLVRDFEGMSKSVEQGNRSSAPTEKAHSHTSTSNLTTKRNFSLFVAGPLLIRDQVRIPRTGKRQSLSALSPYRARQPLPIKPVCITPISCISQKAVHLIFMEKGLKGTELVTIEETDWFWANTKLKEAITTFAQEHERLKSITECSNVFFNVNLHSHASNNWMKADAGSMNSTLNELAGSSEILRVMINAFE